MNEPPQIQHPSPSPASVDPSVESADEHDERHRDLEQSLALLESVQRKFRRGRIALAPYMRSAADASERLEPIEGEGDEDAHRILETVEALERVMRIWENSRLSWRSGLRRLSRDVVSAS